MKVPLVYPKIPDTKDFLPKQCFVYEKYDGTNLHWVRGHNNGWQKWGGFGTRRDRFELTKSGWKEFTEAHPGLDDLQKVWSKFHNDVSYTIDHFSRNCGGREIVIFTEYFGERSFAGQHHHPEPHKLKIIDIQVDGKLIDPYVFDKHFVNKHIVWMPKLLYSGKYSGQLVEDIRAGKYTDGEGAVIKGEHAGQIYMAKVKTDKYMRSLQMKFKDRWKDYWE